MSKAKAIVRMATFPNRTPTGRPSATAVRKLTMYLGYGRGSEREQVERPLRGLWHDQNGKILRHQEVLTWAIEQGQQKAYTYQFILSAKHTDLDEDDYTKALNAGGDLFPIWRLMRHEDSQYPHAHVLAFDNREILIKAPAFQAWCRQVRDALEQIQDQYLELSLDHQQSMGQIEEQSRHHDWGLEL